jgi:hypothetical protein
VFLNTDVNMQKRTASGGGARPLTFCRKYLETGKFSVAGMIRAGRNVTGTNRLGTFLIDYSAKMAVT